MPKLSIIVPFYNAGSFLSSNVLSMTNQLPVENLDVEILYVNNASTDGAERLLTPFVEKNPSIQLINVSEKGVSNARNLALASATGEYIAFCDVDDTLFPNYFETISGTIEKDSHVDLFVFGYAVVDASLKQKKMVLPCDVTNSEELMEQMFLTDSVGGFVWNKLYRKDIIKGILFRKEVSICEDLLFNVELLKTHDNICIKAVPEVLYAYMENPNSASRMYDNLFDSNGNFKYTETFNKILKIVNRKYWPYVNAKLFAIASSVLAGNKNSAPLGKTQKKKVKDTAWNAFGSFLLCRKISCKNKFVFTLYFLFPFFKRITLFVKRYAR